MIRSLHWRTALNSKHAEEQLSELRTNALTLVVRMAGGAAFAWFDLQTVFVATPLAVNRAYLTAPVVALAVVPALVALPRSRRVASILFFTGCLFAIAWTAIVMQSARPLLLFVLLSLAAAFVVHPLGGFAIAASSAAVSAGLAALRPDLISADDAFAAAAFSCAAVLVAWTSTHHLFLALNWYADSFAEAEQRTAEAREHRGELVQAWRQLDSAYFRLDRANAALQAAWTATEAAERSKMELATNISHELRTPLNMIIGYSEMMIASPSTYGGIPLPLPYRGDLTALYRSAQHLLALSDDVLDLGRLEIGRLGLVREPVDLGEIVRDAVTLVSDYVAAKGIELRLELPPEPTMLLVDRVRLRQVLLNLLSNAGRFTERGAIVVRVERRELEVLATVTDTGPGIPESDVESVFDRFMTRGAPGSRHSGVGLGLPLSRHLVEMHGGEMGVRSQVGVGTAFWFTLPLANPESWDGPAGPAAVPAPYLRRTEPLVVVGEAHGTLARLFRRYLTGFRIEATSQQDALARANELNAAAVVVDAPMPEHVVGDVPVIACPLRTRDDLHPGRRDLTYLVKPVSRDGILEAIARASDRVPTRVLIVDDDIRFIRLIDRMLAGEGSRFEVQVAHGGDEALDSMRLDPPDVVLLDLNMPGRDGAAVLDELAHDPRLAGVHPIVVSARDELDFRLPLGDDLIVHKPRGFRLAELIDVVGAVVSQMTPARPPPSAAPGQPAAAPGRTAS